MFQQLKNIERAFTHIRLFSFIVILAAVCISCYSLFISYSLVQRAEGRIYILAEGKVLEAFASTRRENIAVEARDHVATFHRLFFSLSPDDKAIEQSTRKALYLADRTAKQQYDNLKEAGYYSGIINANISQEVQPDSIQIDVSGHPYKFRYVGKQRIVRPTAIITRSLVTEGWLRQVQRSDNNSHGLLIERWVIVNNTDLSIQNR